MANSVEDNSSNSEESSVKDILKTVKSYIRNIRVKWKTVVIYSVIGACLGLLVSIYVKPVYTAKLTFVLQDGDNSSGALSGLASQFGVSLGSSGGKGGLFGGYNIIGFFATRLMMQKTLLSSAPFEKGPELLIDRYIKFNHYRDRWNKIPALKNISFSDTSKQLTRAQDSILNLFYIDISNHFIIDRIDKKVTFIVITYSSKDELFSKYFVETLAHNVTDFYIKTKTSKALATLHSMQHQADSIRGRLNEALTGIASSYDATPNANPSRQVLRVNSQKNAVEVQANTAMLVEVTKNLEYATFTLNQLTPIIEFIDGPILPLDVQKISKLKGIVFGIVAGMFLSVLVISVKKLASDYL